MAKRKKRNAITLISLLLALIALVGVYYWYTNRPAEKVTDTKEDTIALGTIDTSKLTELHYVYQDTDLTLVKQKDTWISQAEPDRPINQDKVNSLIGLIGDISALRLIAAKPDNLEDFGLAKPSGYLQGTLSDGSKVTLQLGNQVSTSNGYYALVNDDGKVYMLATTYGTGLKYTNSDMTATEAAPTIEAANITHLSIDKRDGEDFEILYDESGKRLDSSGSKTYFWYILKPYKEGYTCDSNAVSTLQQNYTTFTYGNCVTYDAKDLSTYGLDNPFATLLIGYQEARTVKLDKAEKDPNTGKDVTEKTVYDPKEYKLSIGNKDENGNYYVKAEGSNSVYTMDASAVDKMLTVNVFSLMNTFVNIPNIATVDKIDVDISGTVYTMSLERKTEKKDDKEETTTTYFYNGAQVEEDTFKDVYQKLIAAQYDTEIKDPVDTKGAAPLLTITYYINDGSTVSASYLPYNDSFDFISTNGETRFFADKRKIEDIITAVKEFKGSKE